MTDDGNLPTVPDTAAHPPSPSASGGAQPALDDRYVLRRLLGSGGMGEVWLAHDRRIDRDIAIKMMRGQGDPVAVARFLREARVQGRLEHPSVVPVHDLGGADSAPYFAMKRLTGTTIAEVISGTQAQWSRRKLLARFVDVCLAVEFAHQRGVIHRDLKPANIMLGDFGETYVLDWGLARIASHDDCAAEPPREIDTIETADLRSDSGSGARTEAGALLGTPGYMSPEQMRGDAVDRRVDVFALGCILFEILAGSPAIPRDQRFEVTLAAPCHRPATRAPDAEIPPELDDACARATASDPARRLATARELADEVQRFLDGDRDLERRRALAAEHAARATAALAREADDPRVEAMREAGRAIAIDPTNREAQDLLARLLLEPPAQVPAGAREQIEADRQTATRTVLRVAGENYAASLALIPIAKLFGVGGTWPFVVVGALLAILVAGCFVLSRRPRLLVPQLATVFISVHVAMVVCLGMFFGPLLFIPLLLFESFPIMLMIPAVNVPGRVVAFHVLALATPLALELWGIVPPSFKLVGDQLVLRAWAVDVAPRTLIVMYLLVIVSQMIVTLRIFVAQRRDQERAQEQIHVQRWRLAQLVTTP